MQTLRFFDVAGDSHKITVSRGCRTDAACTVLADRLGKPEWAIRVVMAGGKGFMPGATVIRGTECDFVVFGQKSEARPIGPSMRALRGCERLVAEPTAGERRAWRMSGRVDPEGFEAQVRRLVDMGFDMDEARQALRASRFDLERAADRLVSAQGGARRFEMLDALRRWMEMRTMMGDEAERVPTLLEVLRGHYD